MATKDGSENEGEGKTTQCKWDTMFLQTAGQTMLGLNQQTPTFLSSVNGDVEWHLRVSPVDGTEESASFLSLKLVVCRYASRSVTIACDLSIRNAMGESCFNKHLEDVFLIEGDSLMLCTAKQAKAMSKGSMPMMFISCNIEAKEVLETGDPSLTQRTSLGKVSGQHELISIESTLSSIAPDTTHSSTTTHAFESSSTSREPLEVRPDSTILNDLERLLERQEYGDVVLHVGDRQIVVYKGILAARSSKFAEMFSATKDEKSAASRVEIKDLDFDVLQEVIRYIYTDSAPNLSKMTNGLYKAADLYQLEQLKVLCEEELCAKLDVENVSDYLLLSVLHNGDKLRDEAIQFIINNRKKVSKTRAWKNLFRQHDRIIGEILLELFPQM